MSAGEKHLETVARLLELDPCPCCDERAPEGYRTIEHGQDCALRSLGAFLLELLGLDGTGHPLESGPGRTDRDQDLDRKHE